MNGLTKKINAIKKAKKKSKDSEFKKIWTQHEKILNAKNKK